MPNFFIRECSVPGFIPTSHLKKASNTQWSRQRAGLHSSSKYSHIKLYAPFFHRRAPFYPVDLYRGPLGAIYTFEIACDNRAAPSGPSILPLVFPMFVLDIGDVDFIEGFVFRVTFGFAFKRFSLVPALNIQKLWIRWGKSLNISLTWLQKITSRFGLSS